MRYFRRGILFSLVAFFLVSQGTLLATEGEKGELDQPSTLNEVFIYVGGAFSPAWDVVIKAAVQSLEGVVEIEADHKREWARVVYDKKIIKAGTIFAKVKEIGFKPALWKDEVHKK